MEHDYHKQGIPSRATEQDVYDSLAGTWCPPDFLPTTHNPTTGVSGVSSVRFAHDRINGAFRGFGFVEFVSIGAATDFYESGGCDHWEVLGCRLHVSYAKSGQLGTAPDAVARDWICERCHAVNFARRTECFKCSCERPPADKRIHVDADAPSNIVKVSGFDAMATTSDDMYSLAAAYAPVQEVRCLTLWTSLPLFCDTGAHGARQDHRRPPRPRVFALPLGGGRGKAGQPPQRRGL